MSFDIFTHANGAFLYDVFMGVASIFGHGSYMTAMATCMTAASIGIMISAVLQGRMVNLLWMIQAIFLYMVLLLPKVPVNIIDRTEIDVAFASSTGIPTVRRVDNVPIGMALVGSSVSTLSKWAVDTFETVFSLPSQMTYSANGPLFGQKLVTKMLDYQPNDAALNNNLQEFWKNCAFYDIGLGFYNFNDLTAQEDIVAFFKTNTAMTRGFYQELNGTKSFVDCRTGITNIEQGLIQNQKDFEKNAGTRSNITMAPVSNTVQAGWTAMPVSFTYLSNISRNASQLLVQSAMINSMDGGLHALAGSADANAAIQGYALARAERERATTFGVMGKMAAEMLPILKNLMEGLMYAVFPFVGLAILFPNGWRAFGYYGKMLIWIGLWPVAFALLHYAMTFFGSFAVQKVVAYYDFSGNLVPARYDIYTQMGIKQVMEKYEAIAGYMMTMIPMVTYVMVSQGGAMMAGMLGRVMDGYSKPAESAAMEASAGNFNIGNTNFQNQSAFQHMSAPTQTAGFFQGNDGAMTTTTSEYGTVYNQNVSSLSVTANSQRAYENATNRAVEQATSHVSQTSANLATARGNAISDAFAEVRTGTSSIGSSTSTQESNQNAINQMTEVVKGSAEKFADSKGWQGEDRRAFLHSATSSLTAGVSAGLNVLGTGASVSGQVGTSANYSRGGSKADTQAASRVEEFLQSDQARDALSKIHTITTAAQTNENNTSTHSTANQFNASYETAKRLEESMSEALQRLDSARVLRSEAESNGYSMNVNETGALINHLINLNPDNWQKGVIDLGSGLDTPEAARTQEAMNSYMNERVQQKIDFNKEKDRIAEKGEEAIKHVATSPISNPTNKDNKLANNAESAANKLKSEHGNGQVAMNNELKGKKEGVEGTHADGSAIMSVVTETKVAGKKIGETDDK